MIWPAQVAWRLHLRALSLASVLALPARFRSAGVGQAVTGLPGGVVHPVRAPPRPLRDGRGLGVRLAPPDPALGAVDLAGQVQVEAGQHAQRCVVLVRGADGSQGVGHGPGRAGDDGGVLGVGLGAARRQVGDASHGQSGQVAHGDAHVLSHRHGQGPDGGGLIDHHQQAPVIGQLLVVGQGPVKDLPALTGSGPWPSALPYRRPVPMKTSMSPISISPAASRSSRYGASQWTTGPCTHACERLLARM